MVRLSFAATLGLLSLATATQGRILEGKESEPRNHAFFAQLQRGCGGSLIAADLILTAAHCFDSKSRNMNVTVGGNDRVITATYPHPFYSKDTKEYDLLIAKLDRPVLDVSYVRMNGNNSLPWDGQNLTVVGFGATGNSSGVRAQSPRAAIVRALPDSQCSEAYGEELWLGHGMICAGTKTGGVATCRDDSGGPLIDSEGTLVGVLSAGFHCGHKDFPGIYGRVSLSLVWAQVTSCRFSDHQPVEFCTTRTPTSSPAPGSPTSSPMDIIPPPPTLPKPAVDDFEGDKEDPTDNAFDVEIDEPFEPHNSLSLQLDIFYDAYAIENSWELKNLDTKKVIDEKMYYTAVREGLMTKIYRGLPTGNYSFKFEDFAKDGICCSYGLGFIRMFQVYNTLDLAKDRLWYHRGNFTGRFKKEFQLGAIDFNATDLAIDSITVPESDESEADETAAPVSTTSAPEPDMSEPEETTAPVSNTSTATVNLYDDLKKEMPKTEP